MNTIYVGVGEFAATKAPMHYIKTLALGSCVAVVIMDVEQKAVGLLHVALPEAAINLKRAEERPGLFADTGIPRLLEEMQKVGSNGNSRQIVKLAGGASIMDSNITFNVGKRNILAIKKCLWQHKLGAVAEDIGGHISRSVSVDLHNGKVTVSSPGRGEWDI